MDTAAAGAFIYWATKVAGVLLFLFFANYFAKKEGHDPKLIFQGGLVAVIFAYLGGRVWYLVQHWRWFMEGRFGHSIWSWLSAGNVLYGWVIGAFLSGQIYCKIRKLPFLPLSDIFLLFTPVAQAFNRIGCFSAGCCYGRKTDLPWAVHYSHLRFPVHPVQLYEMTVDIFIFGVLALIWKKYKRHPGVTTFFYFLLYPGSRFFLEYFRGDQEHFWGGLTIPQITGIILICTAFTAAAIHFLLFAIKENSIFKHLSEGNSKQGDKK